MFSTVHESQLEIRRRKGVKVCVQIANKGEHKFNDGADMWDASLAQLEKVFDKSSLRERSIFYDYDNRFFHAVPLLDHSTRDTESNVSYLSSQSNPTQKISAHAATFVHSMVLEKPKHLAIQTIKLQKLAQGSNCRRKTQRKSVIPTKPQYDSAIEKAVTIAKL
ncbi:hypothetical protein BDR22DRAFT_888437 [Usnea florida]